MIAQRIVFIADFFLEQHPDIAGGAEMCNDQLISLLKERSLRVTKLNSRNIRPSTIEELAGSFFIVSNFMHLSEKSKEALKGERYVIYEHDHKYVSTNNPSKFINMLAPQAIIINSEFYENAMAIICQSRIHSETLQKNLLVDHVINLAGNIWTDEKLNFLKGKIGKVKTKDTIVMSSRNKNKGTTQTIEYCKKNDIEYSLIKPCAYEEFIDHLAVAKRIIFFPQWLESFNRLSIEARIVGCQLVTNSLVGATSEEWFKKYKGEALVTFLREKREEIVNTFLLLIASNNKAELFHKFIKPIKVPKISIVTSLYAGGKYIRHFLSEITKQSVFSKCELIILDANSPDGEYKSAIKEYMLKFPNIIYRRLGDRLTVQETMNLGIDMSSGEFLTLANVDDTRAFNALEKLAQLLSVDSQVDLVYADSLETPEPNETFDNNSSGGRLYEHSLMDFSLHNMIKCLPGPMPMWRKEMNTRHGVFDTNYKYAGDWEMWLRAARGGTKFKKLHKVLGLYYNNPKGLSTDQTIRTERFKEERFLFHSYKDMFGEKNSQKYLEYFK